MKLLKAREVGKILGLSTQALYKLRVSGKGPPFIKLESGSIRYEEEQLINYMKGE